ncbi:MAG TPA: hypothetical protein VK926_09305 [Gaiellaceae bacterium]|nr:hypothetical protein [Gaiellaceae bacterium]
MSSRIVRDAGLAVRESGDGSLAFEWPDRETMLRGLTSAGGLIRIAHIVGDAALESAVSEAMQPFRTRDGRYRVVNDWYFVLAAA